MPNVCILTDGTAQFTHSNYLGHDRVFVIPFGLQTITPQENLTRSGEGLSPQLIPPSPKDFIDFYYRLSHTFDIIFVLTLSSRLVSISKYALSVSQQYVNHINIIVIDSLTTGVGLGLVVQAAAAEAVKGVSIAELERKIRAYLPRIYMICCIPDLQFLAQSSYMRYSQALVGKMMGMLPIFSIEEGRLTLIEKARTQRHLFESYLEFIDEFNALAYIGLVSGSSQGNMHTKPLRQHIRANFPQTPFGEHAMNAQLAALLGPNSTGLVILDGEEQSAL
jgi:DegV family protein with EDD domain